VHRRQIFRSIHNLTKILVAGKRGLSECLYVCRKQKSLTGSRERQFLAAANSLLSSNSGSTICEGYRLPKWILFSATTQLVSS